MRTLNRNRNRRRGRVDAAAIVAGLLVITCLGLAAFYIMRSRAQATQLAISRIVNPPMNQPMIQLEATRVNMPQQFAAQTTASTNGSASGSADNASSPIATNTSTRRSNQSRGQRAFSPSPNRTTTIMRPVIETEMVPSADDPNVFVPRQTTRYVREEIAVPSGQQSQSSYRFFAQSVAPEKTNQLRSLVNRIRSIPAKDRTEEDLASLEELVANQFELQHQAQVDRLKKILDQASETQKVLEERNQKKDEIVQRRVLELLGQKDPMNWDYQIPNASPFGFPRRTSSNANPPGFDPQRFSANGQGFPANSQAFPTPQPQPNSRLGQNNFPEPRPNDNAFRPPSSPFPPSQPRSDQRLNRSQPTANEAFQDWIAGTSQNSNQSRNATSFPQQNSQGQFSPRQNSYGQNSQDQNSQNQNSQGQSTRARSSQGSNQRGRSGQGQNQNQGRNNSATQSAQGSNSATASNFNSTANQASLAEPTSGNSSNEPPSNSLVSVAHSCKREIQKLRDTERLVKRGFVPVTEVEKIKNKIEELQDIWTFQREELQQEMSVAEIELESAAQQFETYSSLFRQGTLSLTEMQESRAKFSKSKAKYDVAKNRMNWVKKYESDSGYGLVQSESETTEEESVASEVTEQDIAVTYESDISISESDASVGEVDASVGEVDVSAEESDSDSSASSEVEVSDNKPAVATEETTVAEDTRIR